MRPRNVLVLISMLLAAACGSSEPSKTTPDESGGDDANPEAKAEEEPSKPKAEAEEKCERVSKGMSKAIASGEESGAGLKPVKAAAVKSPDFKDVHFVAIEMKVAGVDNQVGVWATNSLKPGGGTIMAVDGIAQQFTVWPDADKIDAQISKADPSVKAATNCLG